MPPIANITMKPSVNSIGGSNRMRPRYMVNSQSKTLTPVGTAMTIVAMPNTALTFALAPMVKKWCSQTVKDNRAMTAVA